MAQDCILSLSFDRRPVSFETLESIRDTSSEYDFMGCMFELTNIGRAFMEQTILQRTSTTTVFRYVLLLEELRAKRETYLQRNHPRHSKRIRMESHTLRLQISSLMSFFCRRFFKFDANTHGDSEELRLSEKARQSFLDIIEAFLDLKSLTVLPLRSWSMIHAGISSALFLWLHERESGNQDPGSQATRSKFINLLSSDRADDESSGDAESQSLLCMSHSRALRLLKSRTTTRHRAPETGHEQPLSGTQTEEELRDTLLHIAWSRRATSDDEATNTEQQPPRTTA